MKYTLELPGEDVNLIVAALAELPAKNSMDTIIAVQKQVFEQNEREKGERGGKSE